ncbi:MAG: response regulator [Phycisphaerales bacterium]|nr:MAG: response regulator [Phycisphaerales bacterium]
MNAPGRPTRVHADATPVTPLSSPSSGGVDVGVCGSSEAAGASLPVAGGSWGGLSLRDFDVFSNFGNYMPRTHCMSTAEGSTDWLWVILLGLGTLGVIGAYARIMLFWRKAYLAEAPQDRNTKMYDLAQIFLWCAICGYAMSIVMFFWPAYRLLAVLLVMLNLWSWKFAANLEGFGVSLQAKRLERELAESLTREKAELERLVAQRTSELERMTDEAEAANRAKSDFIAGMSHEIRTPMTAILGFAELIRSGDLTPEEQAEHAETICRNGEHLIEVINDVLDLSKIEAGRMEVDHQASSPRRLLEDVDSMLRHRAESKGLKLEVVGGADLPEAIVTDPTRVRQILTNLLGNAIKFTESGSVTIRAWMDGGADGSPWLVVEVGDSGIGIPAECLEAIFQPFRQADATTTRRFGGTGLGLSISRNLAELLGGTLSVQSELGCGSVFTLRIPAPSASAGDYEAGAGTAHADDASAVECRGSRVLLADDGADNRRLIGHHLRKAGFRVDEAGDGAEAVRRVLEGEGSFDLIVLDMQMPVMDGYTAARTLRESGWVGPILALTANAMHEDRERCLTAGCDEYGAKPIDAPTLIATCRTLIEQHRRPARAA